MPPRNNPLPSSLRLFNCTICDKGYPRQLDYENHLGSYDHNHRQRLADMKKLTASNDAEGSKPKQGLDMRSINVEDANKKPGVGGRFTKIGGGGGAVAGGSRFKKVGVAVGGAKEGSEEVKKDEGQKKEDAVLAESEEKPSTVDAGEKPDELKKDEDAVMMDDDEEEAVTWEEYDFTKPTGCDHANCPGCKTDGIWNGGWVSLRGIATGFYPGFQKCGLEHEKESAQHICGAAILEPYIDLFRLQSIGD
ncbi:Nn.00g090450.m01.CDS01 [Neocucurbitaria sp. VM-36]